MKANEQWRYFEFSRTGSQRQTDKLLEEYEPTTIIDELRHQGTFGWIGDYFPDQTHVWVQNFRKDDNFNQQQVALNKQESYKDLANNTKTLKQLPPGLSNNKFFRDLKRADAQDRMKTRTGTTTIDKFGPTRALRMDLLSSTTLHSFTVCRFSNGGAVTGQYVLTAILPFLLKLYNHATTIILSSYS